MNEVTTTIENDDDNDVTSAGNGVNDQRVTDMNAEIRKLGREAGTGAESLPKLGLRTIRWAKDGLMDDKGAARAAYEMYRDSDTKRRNVTQPKGSLNAQVSKLNSFRTAGLNKDFDAEAEMNRAVEIGKAFLESGEKIIDVYAAYVKVARMFSDRKPEQGSPTDDELKACFLPAEKKELTVAEIIQKARDGLEDLATGERKDGNSCQDQEVLDAIGKLDDWLNKMMLQSEMDALRAKLNAMGMNINIEPTSCGEAQPVTPTIFLTYSNPQAA